MALIQNNAEGGTNGTTVTTGNSGGVSGDAWSLVNIPASSTITYDTVGASHGSLGYNVTTAATNLSPYFEKVVTTANRHAVRFYFKLPVLPSVTNPICVFRLAAATAADIRVSSTNQLRLTDSAGGTLVTTTTTLVANTWYRCEAAVDAVGGGYALKLFAGDSTTPLDDLSGSGGSFGAAQLTKERYGKPASGTFIGTIYIDSIAAQDLATGFIGPVSNPTSTVRPTSVVSNPGVFTNVGGSASLEAAMADESDTTYAQSPANPAGAAITFGFSELAAGAVTVNVRHYADVASPPIARTYDLMQGATVISTRTVSPLPTTVTAYSWTTNSTETANITDRTQLRLRVTDTV